MDLMSFQLSAISYQPCFYKKVIIIRPEIAQLLTVT